MTASNPVWESLTTAAPSAPVRLDGGIGAMAIKTAVGLTAHLEISIDEKATWQTTGDAFSGEISRKVDQASGSWARLVVTAGTCDVFIRTPSYHSMGRR